MSTYNEPDFTPECLDDQTNPRNAFDFNRSPYNVMGGVARALKEHFGSASNINDPDLKGYIWTPDERATRLSIEPAHKVNLRNTQQRPALLLSRGEVGFELFGLGGGRSTAHFDTDGPMEGFQRGVNFNSAARFNVSVTAVGQTGAESELLGWESAMFLLTYAPVLKESMRLGTFIVKGLGKPQLLPENKDNWVSQVELTVASAISWRLSVDGPVLKKIVSSMDL
jgi:hypothetical protein